MPDTTATNTKEPISSAAEEKKANPKREIQGGLPYSTSPGVFKRALEAMISAERPEKFTGNFLETVLRLTGGSARPVPPMLKKMHFLSSDGTPTELYSKFKTESGRSAAALEGLKYAYAELFRRNEVIYRADEAAVVDLIVEVNGLKRSDPIVRMTYQTFEAIRGFIDKNAAAAPDHLKDETSATPSPAETSFSGDPSHTLGLSYQINIVLPETDDISVFNAIFKSLRENLL